MINWAKIQVELGIKPTTIKVRDRIYVTCSLCGLERLIIYRMYKRITNNDIVPYKCANCTRKQNGQKLAALKYKCDRIVASQNTKKLWQNPEYRNKVSQSVSLALSTPEQQERLRKVSRDSTTRLWSKPEYRGKISDRIRSEEVRIRIKKGLNKAFSSPILRKKLSDNTQKLWLNNQYREKITKSSIKSFRERPHCSSLQIILYSILDDIGVKYSREWPDRPPDEGCCIGPYTFDCVVSREGKPALIIECNGDWIHSRKSCQISDQQRASYIVNNLSDKYELKCLWEHEFKCKNKIIEIVKYWLGITTQQVVNFNFNDVVIKNCNAIEGNLLLSKYHYLPNAGRNGIRYGAYIRDHFIAVCVFSPVIRQNIKIGEYKQDEVRELSRLCIHPKYQKKNFASWFITGCLRLLSKQYKVIISYCDTTFNHSGSVYKACGFLLDKEVEPDYWYVNKNGWVMHKKTLYNHAVKIHKTEKEFANEYDYVRVYGKKKLRFIKYCD